MVDLWHLVLIVTSVFYSILIGANASYAMAASFGSRAMSKVKILFLLSISLFLGAMTASKNVVETIAGGVCFIPGDVTVAYVILVSALFCVLMANIFKIPLSTSEVTVGAVVGAGIYLCASFSSNLFFIVFSWIILSLLAFILSYFISKGAGDKNLKESSVTRILLILVGCFVAFSIGANNVANSIGPILNTDSLTLRGSLLVGAIPMAIGALLFGGRVMGNVGSNIIRLNSYDALIISLIAGIIIFVASILGIPMPVAQIFTLSIVGVRYAKPEMSVPMSNKIIKEMLIFWVISPIVSLVVSFSAIFILYKFFI
jgi:Phosphate/sulphate permeases